MSHSQHTIANGSSSFEACVQQRFVRVAVRLKRMFARGGKANARIKKKNTSKTPRRRLKVAFAQIINYSTTSVCP